MVKFQSTLHQKLWTAMKNSWYLVKKFGLTDTKIHIRQSILNDPSPIFNSCYACEYDVQMAESKGEKHMCKYCPIYIERCKQFKWFYKYVKLFIKSSLRLSPNWL